MRRIVIAVVAWLPLAALAADKTTSRSRAPRSSPTPGSPMRRSTRASAATAGNISPSLSWKDPPAGTKSFAVTVYDPDAPTGSGWWHWVVFNLPADVRSLPAGAGNPASGKLPKGAVQSLTDFGAPGYGGPCPPRGDRPHRYVFTVHALKVDKLDLDEKAMPALVGFMVTSNRIARRRSPRRTAASSALGRERPAAGAVAARDAGARRAGRKAAHGARRLSADAERARRRLQPEDEPRSGHRRVRRRGAGDGRPPAHAVARRRIERRPRDALLRTTSSACSRVPSQSVALLAALMLRGPQTVGELRISTERLHRFADASAVEGFLHELGQRSAGGARRRIAAPAGHARDALDASAVGRARARERHRARHRATSWPPRKSRRSRPTSTRLRRRRGAQGTVAQLCAELGIAT